MAKHRGIYKRGNVWWIRYMTIAGLRQESSQSSHFKDAQTLLIDRRKAVSDGKDDPKPRRIQYPLFKELAEQYGKWAERQRSYHTKKYFIKNCQRPPKTSHYWPPENQPFLGGICHHLLFIKEKMDGEFSEDGFVEFNQGFAGQGMVA